MLHFTIKPFSIDTINNIAYVHTQVLFFDSIEILCNPHHSPNSKLLEESSQVDLQADT